MQISSWARLKAQKFKLVRKFSFKINRKMSRDSFGVSKIKRFILFSMSPWLLRLEMMDFFLESKTSSTGGVAHRKFDVDKYGGIRGYAAEETDLELTSCLQSGICTYSITGPEDIEQSGFLEGGLKFCAVCGPLIPGRPASYKISRKFHCVMGEAESDPETPRISPFKFINRPHLKGDAAYQALESVENLLEQGQENSGNSGNTTIQVQLNRNHEKAGRLCITVRSLEDIRNVAEKQYGFAVKRLYFGNGHVIFNFEQIMRKSKSSKTVAVWASQGDSFSTKETFSQTTKFVKQTKKQLYTQGAEWKKILVTVDKNQYEPIAIQGRTMEELNNAAMDRLGLSSVVTAYVHETSVKSEINGSKEKQTTKINALVKTHFAVEDRLRREARRERYDHCTEEEKRAEIAAKVAEELQNARVIEHENFDKLESEELYEVIYKLKSGEKKSLMELMASKKTEDEQRRSQALDQLAIQEKSELESSSSSTTSHVEEIESEKVPTE